MHNTAPQTTPTTAPTLDAIWALGGPAAPSYLVASIATSTLVPGDYSSSLHYVGYDVDCPPSSHPEHSLCSALGIYPAHVYHTQGSIYGGTFTNRHATATTAWRCGLGTCNKKHGDGNVNTSLGECTGVLQATCNATVTDARGSVATTTTFVDGCDGPFSSIPVQITAGAEKLIPPYRDIPAPVGGDLSKWVDLLRSGDQSWLAKGGCPTKRPDLAGAVASLTSGGGAGTITSGPTAGGAGQTGTPQTTSSTKSEAEKWRAGAGLGFVMLLMCGLFNA